MESQIKQKNSLEYWKERAEQYEQRAIDIQQELDEFTENSSQLEKELDASLVQLEKQNVILTNQNQRLEGEVEMLKNKLERMQQEGVALESELTQLKVHKDKQNEYIRELEQKNDDLERGQRNVAESLSYIEALLNQAYERNAVLESEVDEKENLKIELQRISDEARDLKQELKVKERVPATKKEEDSANDNISMNGHNHINNVEIGTQYVPLTPLKREVNGNGMTPSSRVTALNIVGDMLRKIGLERFLCRECGRVKCTCEPSIEDSRPQPQKEAEPTCFGYNGSLPNDTDEESDQQIVYRNHNPSVRQRSESENCDSEVKTTHRLSEQPFSRSGESGKLRKSFAVRSREGIENLFSFAPFKKSPEHDKMKVRARLIDQ